MECDSGFGTLEIMLDAYIKDKGLSKSKIAYKAEMQRTQLNNYINGNIQRLDISVLCRLCYALECDLSDIVRYVPPKQK